MSSNFMPSLRQIADALGGDVSGNQVLAPGPGHSATDRSLAVSIKSDAPDGFLVHSFADDDPLACKDYVRERLGQKRERRANSGGTQEWVYRDKNGQPYLKVRRYMKDGGKKYVQSHWDAVQWVLGKPKGPKIPYRLPELLRAGTNDVVHFVEGEKCADALAVLGLVATTASEGAEARWREELNHWFADRLVVVLPDNDATGRKHAAKVQAALASVARRVVVVPLPGLTGEGDDVHDWLTRDKHTKADLAKLTAAALHDGRAELAGRRRVGAWRLDLETEFCLVGSCWPG